MSIMVLRTLVLYLLIVFALRFMGKRQIGELQPGELVTTILISNIAALPIEDYKIPMLGAMIPIILLFCLEIIVSYLGSRHTRFRYLATGSPKIIIKDGLVDQKMMDKLRISAGDLLEEMRQKDIYDIRQVQFAIIETSGKISFYKKADYQNAEKGDVLRKVPQSANPPLAVVTAGTIIKNALHCCGKDERWLLEVLKTNGLELKDVYLMTCDSNGQYSIVEAMKR